MFDAIPLESTFPYLFLDLACKPLCFPPGKGIKRTNESAIGELFRTFSEILFVVLTILNQSLSISSYFLY